MEIQKGFTPKVVGVLEHTSMMANIIDKVRKSQRSVVMILLGLNNTFVGVHQNFMQEILLHHHIPDKISLLASRRFKEGSCKISKLAS